MINSLQIKNGLVNNRENIHLEFKKTFHSQHPKSYIKSVCAFANNNGGIMVFGVEDKPRKPIGLGGDLKTFKGYDTKSFATVIQNCLSVNIDFEFYDFEQHIEGSKIVFGAIEIKEAYQKPVICKVSDGKNNLREGAIYYRYSAKSEEIKAQDLIYLIQREKDKEKELWVKNIQKMAQIGVSNVGVFSYDGELFAGNQKVIIDKDVIDKIKFIKEGHFIEKDGTPALTLKGEIKNIESLEIVHTTSDPNKTHPFEGFATLENEIVSSPKLSELIKTKKNDGKSKYYIFVECKEKEYTLAYLIQCIKKKLGLDEITKYCWTNEKKTVKKYNKKAVDICVEYIACQKKLYSIFDLEFLL
jgi:hypothetical protein